MTTSPGAGLFWKLPVVSYLTFWSRKTAALRVWSAFLHGGRSSHHRCGEIEKQPIAVYFIGHSSVV